MEQRLEEQFDLILFLTVKYIYIFRHETVSFDNDMYME